MTRRSGTATAIALGAGACRRRSRRLRKKLHVGEFRELGFEISLSLSPGLSQIAEDAFWQAFIVDCVEARGLAYGGATTGYLARAGRGSVTVDDHAAVRAWLAGRGELTGFELGPLEDAYHPPPLTDDLLPGDA